MFKRKPDYQSGKKAAMNFLKLRLFIVSYSLLFITMTASGQTTLLDTMCLVDNMTEALQLASMAQDSGQISDTLGIELDSLEIRGDCDSVQIGYEVSVFNQKIFMPLATLQKLNSCSLSLSYAVSDTIINTCSPIASSASAASVPKKSLQVSQQGDHVYVKWNRSKVQVQLMRIVRFDGKVLSTISTGDRSDANIKRYSYPVLVVADLLGGGKLCFSVSPSVNR